MTESSVRGKRKDMRREAANACVCEKDMLRAKDPKV